MLICVASNCRAYTHEDSKFCFTHLVKSIQTQDTRLVDTQTINTAEGPLFTGKLVDRPQPTLEKSRSTQDPLRVQVDGSHYKKLAIQPIEYIHANGIPFAEGSVIKYVSRWRDKGGIKDLEKAKHFIELLISLETRNKEQG